LPHPFVETACVVAPLLDSVGDPDDVVAELIDGSRQAGVVPLTGSLVPWGDAVTYLLLLDHRPSLDGPWLARRVSGGVSVGGDAGTRALADSLDGGRHVVQLGAWQAVSTVGRSDDAAL